MPCRCASPSKPVLHAGDLADCNPLISPASVQRRILIGRSPLFAPLCALHFCLRRFVPCTDGEVLYPRKANSQKFKRVAFDKIIVGLLSGLLGLRSRDCWPRGIFGGFPPPHPKSPHPLGSG